MGASLFDYKNLNEPVDESRLHTGREPPSLYQKWLSSFPSFYLTNDLASMFEEVPR